MKDRRTVEYAGKFDTTGIIDGLKRIRNELNKTVNSNEGKSALGNIDKQLAQLEKSSIQIKSALDKGFTSTSEIKAFEKELDKIYSGALQIKNGLQAVSRTEVKINTKESQKELEKLEKEIEQLKSKALKELLRVIDSSKFSDKSTLKMQAQQGKLTKENLEAEVEERKDVLKQQKAQLEATKEQLILSEKLKLAESSIKKGKINASPFTSENISDLIKYNNNTWKGYDTSIRQKGKTNYTNKFTDNADIVLNSVYVKSLKQATISAKNETDALQILTDALIKYNIVLKDSGTLANTFKQSWAKIVTSEDVSNINAATIARNKAVTSQEKAIEKTRMEIVQYSLIADAVDEYENELSEADSKLEKFTNDAIKNNAALESIDNEAEHLGNNINEWGDAVHITSEGLKETTERQQRLNDTFDGMKTAVVTLLSIGNIFMQMRQEISKTYEDIKELDKAFGQIAMVTEFSIEDMWNKYEAYAKIANELGQSTLSVVQASGLYFQQGLEEAEALELTTSTMKLATLAGLDFEQATSLMTSAVRGFHMEMSQGEHVTDVYSELAAHAAASVNDIATAMSRTAAIASSAGMEFETTSAMLTTMIEATQESPETLGTAMKTVVARFTELKNNVSDTESEFEDLDYNKVDKALKSIGVALKDTNGQFRDIDEVFLEVAEKWDTLDRNSQRYVATIAAGSRQQSRFIALMENYDRTLELIEIAQDSAGRSSEQFAKYQDTLENKVNRLRNSWEQLKLSFIGSDIFKDAVDGLNSFIKTLGKMDGKQLAGFSALGIIIAKNLVANVTKGLKKESANLSKAWQDVLTKIYEEKNNEPLQEYNVQLTKAKFEQQLIKEELEQQVIAEQKARVEYEKSNIEIKEQEHILKEMEMEIKEIENNEGQITDEKRQQLEFQKEYVAELQKENAERKSTLITEKNSTASVVQSSQEIDANVEELEKEDPAKKIVAHSEMVSLVGSAVASGIMVGVTTAVASKDTKTAILAAGGTLATSLGPILLEKFIVAGLEKLAASAVITAATPVIAAAAPVLIGIALTYGANMFADWLDKMGDELIDPINQATKQLEKEQKKLNESAEKAQTSSEFAKTTKENADSIKELVEGYEELSNKQFKTTEEQEKFDEIINQIKEKYPDLISYENERTGEIRIQVDLLKEQLEIAQELSKNAEKKALLDEKRVNSGVYATTLSSIELGKEQKINEVKNKASNDFIKKVKENYGEEHTYYNDDQLEEIFKYFNGESDLKKLYKKGINNDPKYLKERYEDLYKQSKVSNKEFKLIEKETTEEQQKAWNQYLKSQREAYANYAIDLYNLDEEVANIITNQAFVNPEKYLSEKDKELRDNFVSELGDFTEKTVADYSKLALDSDYNNILAAIFGIDNTQEDWTTKLSETMAFSKMSAGDMVSDFVQILGLGEVTDQIDNFWESIKDETYDEYLSLKEDISSGEMSYNDLIGLDLTGNNELDIALKNQIEDVRQNVTDIMTNTDNGVSPLELLGLAKRDKTGQFLSFYSSELDKFSESTANGLKQITQNIIDSLGKNATNEQKRTAVASFRNMFSDIVDTEDIPQIMSLFNFEDINATNFEQYSEQIKKSIEEIEDSTGKAKYSAEEAQQIIDNVFSYAEDNNIYNPYLDNYAELMNYMDAIPEKMETIKNESSDIVGWVATADKNGLAEITTDEISKLKELGAQLGINTEQYIKFDEKTKKYHVEAVSLYKDINDFLDKQLALIDESIENTEDESLKKDLEEQRTVLVGLINEQKSELNVIDKMAEKYSTLVSTVSTLTSAYKSMSNEMLESGHISSSSYDSLSNALDTINSEAGGFKIKTKEITDFIYEQNGAIKLDTQSFYEYIESLITALEAEDIYGNDLKLLNKLKLLRTELQETKAEVEKTNQEAWDTYNSNVQSKYEEWQEALDKVKEKEEAVAEAEEKVKEAEEKLLETEEKLQEIYYGEEHHKNKNDYLYNYNVELEQLEERISRVKEALDDMQPGDNAHEKVQEYIDALREEITAYKAQNEVIKQYIENQKQMLDSKLSERLEQLKAEGAVDTSTNISDFYYERNGRFYIDYQKLNAAKLPDDITDFIEEQIENMNNYAKAYEENLDKISDAEKEFRERQKKARDEYLNTENKVVELLKKKDQEELDSLKEKYDGMKEADDEYTDALEKSIKKQRDLRNQANQWDDLAEKEKKLSLQQRDTSGANAKEIKKTQEDIAKTRESLLDSAVDNIINNLKELYEEQEETRQAEIEYRQAILDNKNYVDEATAIINNWDSVEEAKAWFMQFDEEFINASDATIDKLLEDYEGYYNNTVMYNEWMNRSYEEVTNQTAEEIQEKTRETSETLTTETDRTLDEVMEDVHEAQEQGRKDVEEAKKAVSDAKDAVVKATEEVAKALEEARKKQEEYNEAIKNQPAPGGKGGDNDNKQYYVEPNPDNNPNTPGPSNYDTNQLMGQYFAQHPPISSTKIQDVIDWVKKGNGNVSFNDVIQYIKEHVSSSKHGYWDNIAAYYTNDIPQWAINKGQIFKTGGLVDYTGPAWVDGTPSNPEAFLSATDTRLIREFIDLATFQLNPTEYQNNITSNHTIGDQAFNININVESISSDYDVDQMIERMHEDILSITNEPGSSVMLHK